MERKIGEIFEYNGEWYQCVEGNDCANCVFIDYCKSHSKEERDSAIGLCVSFDRNDGMHVIFKKLEKVGEPYKYYIKCVEDVDFIIVQEYILPNPSYIWNDEGNVFIRDCYNGRIAIEIKQNKEDMEENKTTFPKEDNALTRTVYAYVSGEISDKELIRSIKEMFDEYSYNKNNLKPFSLELAKQGKPVCTRDGRKGRILCYDFKQNEEYPILVAVENKDGKECALLYSNDGISEMYKSSNNDLMMLSEKKEGWVNVYKGGLLDTKSYPTKKEAFDKASPTDYVDTIKINWSE